MSDTPVVRIVKKKLTHAKHHGGSWKVAYADFVTAMMAFFLVMWIISMDQSTREQIQDYFNDPASASNSPAGISKLAAGGTSAIAAGSKGLMSGKAWGSTSREAQKERLAQVRESLQKEIAHRPDLARLKEHVSLDLTRRGLVIELIEASDSLFFQSGSAGLSPETHGLLAIIARELGKVPNSIVIEGHTDSVPYAGRADYSNWELSADRANAARRAMERMGLRFRQVVEVRGYADSQLRDPHHPTHASNRRVSILVNYSEPTEAPAKGTDRGDAAKGEQSPFDLGIRPEPVTQSDAASSAE
jgi:chemotaxis protein MotB